MFVVRQVQQGEGARHADREAGGNGFVEVERLAVGVEEHGRGGAGGGVSRPS